MQPWAQGDQDNAWGNKIYANMKQLYALYSIVPTGMYPGPLIDHAQFVIANLFLIQNILKMDMQLTENPTGGAKCLKNMFSSFLTGCGIAIIGVM